MSTKIKIITAISIVICGLAVTALLKYNQPHKDIQKVKADFKMNSQQLLYAFETNENLANAKYLDKVLSVKGLVEKVDTNTENPIITLTNNQFLGSVMCHLENQEKQKLAKFKKGDSVYIKGICTGYLMDVVLVKCIIQ